MCICADRRTEPTTDAGVHAGTHPRHAGPTLQLTQDTPDTQETTRDTQVTPGPTPEPTQDTEATPPQWDDGALALWVDFRCSSSVQLEHTGTRAWGSRKEEADKAHLAAPQLREREGPHDARVFLLKIKISDKA